MSVEAAPGALGSIALPEADFESTPQSLGLSCSYY